MEATTFTDSCLYCQSLLPTDKRPYKRYCNSKCRNAAVAQSFRKDNPRTGLPTGTVGAMSELIAAADLMRKGYDVFRSLSPACPCDLAILINDKLLRIEVKTGYRIKSGKLLYAKPLTNRYDIIAVVVGATEVIYTPALPPSSKLPFDFINH